MTGLPGAAVIPSSSSSASADLGMELDEAALQDAMAADNHAHTAGTPTTAGSTSSNSSSSSSGGASTGDHKEGAGSARPVSVKRSASSMACNTAPIKYQVPPTYRTHPLIALRGEGSE